MAIARISMFRAKGSFDNYAIILTDHNKSAKIPQGFDRVNKSYCGEVSDKDISDWIKNGYQIHDNRTVYKWTSENQIKWDAYLLYLQDWVKEHHGIEFIGMSPVCFDEWDENENDEEK